MFTPSLEGNVNCLCLRGRTGCNLHILIAPFDSSRRSVFDWGSRNMRLKDGEKKISMLWRANSCKSNIKG